MLNPVVQEAVNRQINHEFNSTYLYLSMSAYFETLNLRGFAHWMRVQSQEETSHAMKLFDYVHDRNGQVNLEGITQPRMEFQSPVDAFQQALKHENDVTETIHRLYKLANQEEDYAIQSR